MIFFKKKKMIKDHEEQLLRLLEKAKTEWVSMKSLYERSVEPSDELRYEVQLAKSKYMFLMREAKDSNLRTRR